MAKQVYCGYTLKCETCGVKKAAWTVDSVQGDNTAKAVADSFKQQEEHIVDTNHANHEYRYLVKVADATNANDLMARLEVL